MRHEYALGRHVRFENGLALGAVTDVAVGHPGQGKARPLPEPLTRRGQAAPHIVAVGPEQRDRRAQKTPPGDQLVGRAHPQGKLRDHRLGPGFPKYSPKWNVTAERVPRVWKLEIEPLDEIVIAVHQVQVRGPRWRLGGHDDPAELPPQPFKDRQAVMGDEALKDDDVGHGLYVAPRARRTATMFW